MSGPPWRRWIKTAARHAGFDVVRWRPESSEPARVQAVMRHLGVDLVLDVGANEGQYALGLRESGYRGRIVSFEPLADAHARLAARAAADPRWVVHERCALGDTQGDVTLHVAGNGVSSSLLPMLQAHARAAPHSVYVGDEVVPMARLDDVAPAYLDGAGAVWLKVDTQGYEAPVLRGAPSLLAHCRALQLELSLVPLYEGQMLWERLVDELRRQGFVLWTVLPGFVDPQTGRTLQIDGILVRD